MGKVIPPNSSPEPSCDSFERTKKGAWACKNSGLQYFCKLKKFFKKKEGKWTSWKKKERTAKQTQRTWREDLKSKEQVCKLEKEILFTLKSKSLFCEKQ